MRLVAGWVGTDTTFFDHFFFAAESRSACGDIERDGTEEIGRPPATIQCPACVDVLGRLADGIARVEGIAS